MAEAGMKIKVNGIARTMDEIITRFKGKLGSGYMVGTHINNKATQPVNYPNNKTNEWQPFARNARRNKDIMFWIAAKGYNICFLELLDRAHMERMSREMINEELHGNVLALTELANKIGAFMTNLYKSHIQDSKAPGGKVKNSKNWTAKKAILMGEYIPPMSFTGQLYDSLNFTVSIKNG